MNVADCLSMFISDEIYLVIAYSPLAVTNPVAYGYERWPNSTNRKKHSNGLTTLAEFSGEKLAIVLVIFFAYIALGLTNQLR